MVATHFEARDPHLVLPTPREMFGEKKHLDGGCDQTHPAAFEHKGLVIGPQCNVRPTAWPGPADTHVSSSHHLKLEIPLSRSHCIGSLYPEESNLVDADFLHSWVRYCEKERKQSTGRKESIWNINNLVAFLKRI